MAPAHVTPEAKGVLERACRDCHSNDTRWRGTRMSTYLWMHDDAHVSDADVAALCAWTDSARASLRDR
jgi:hypothetical protein